MTQTEDGNVTEKKQRRKILEFDSRRDLRYRGPLSYRAFRIMGWLCIAMSQAVVLMSLVIRVDPTMTEMLSRPRFVLDMVSSMALPFMLIANFSLILNRAESYKSQIIRFGVVSLLIAAAAVIVYLRYILGGLAVFMGGRREAADLIENSFYSYSGNGSVSFNIFIDLFLCTLLMFFMNFRPKRVFTGKRLMIFRAFAALPILYELASLALKCLAAEKLIRMPFIVFPFLTVKPPMTFLVFIVLAIYIKNRERHFIKNGRTHEDYEEFLKTNRNSFHFSRFTAIVLAAAGVIDFIGVFGTLFLSLYRGSVTPGLVSILSSTWLDALGFGESVTMLLLAPLMLLFSYTRLPKNRNLDIFIPIGGIALIVLIYIEGGYQCLQDLPYVISTIGF